MELYIPPPMHFLPRLPPPRPAAPPVPVVPIPDLPDVIHAPEGAYTLNKELFPSIGTPVAPLPYENRPMPQSSAASMLGGAGGFILAPPPPNAPPPGQTAMSWGTTVVNGQPQPAHPVRFSWVNVYFPPKAADGRGFGAMIGMGGNAAGVNGGQVTSPPLQQAAQGHGYEPSVSSDSEPSTGDMPPIPIMEVPLTALPNAQSSKRNVWGRSTSVAPNALAALPRPKTNLRSSNSTFVTRLQAADNLPKIIAERGKGATSGEWTRWGFWNLGRTFGWGEEGGKQKDPFARVTFSHVPTCHAVSHITAGPERLDIIIGFTSGDIVWLDFIVGKYSRINKGPADSKGLFNSSSVVSINFHPLQPHHFTAAFANGTFMQFNLFAEDPVTTISATALPWEAVMEVHDYQVAQAEAHEEAAKFQRPSVAGLAETNGNGAVQGDKEKEQQFEDRMTLWKNEDWAQLKDRAARGKKGPEEAISPWAGKNPVAVYKIGSKPARSIAYSPDGAYLAIASEDGMLRLVDTADERLLDTFAGYYAALNCVAWSPDSRFVAVGGQDDLIAIYSPREARLVARCQGHSAFVTCIAFDPTIRTGGYRFASVGEDAKLVLWDFTAASLHRPRHHPHHANSSHHRISTVGSTASLVKLGTSAAAAEAAQAQLQSQGQGVKDHFSPRFHPAPPRSEVALLQPVFARVVEGNLLTSVHMGPAAIVTVGRAAGVKFWMRPPRVPKGKDKRGGTLQYAGRERARGSPLVGRGQGLVGA